MGLIISTLVPYHRHTRGILGRSLVRGISIVISSRFHTIVFKWPWVSIALDATWGLKGHLLFLVILRVSIIIIKSLVKLAAGIHILVYLTRRWILFVWSKATTGWELFLGAGHCVVWRWGSGELAGLSVSGGMAGRERTRILVRTRHIWREVIDKSH